jgi:hypothetical protein
MDGVGWRWVEFATGVSLWDGVAQPINLSEQVKFCELPRFWLAASSTHLSSWCFPFFLVLGYSIKNIEEPMTDTADVLRARVCVKRSFYPMDFVKRATGLAVSFCV